VGLLSIHRWPFYPGTGDADETGSGDGVETTVNIPVEFGTPLKTYHDRFSSALESLAARMRPELVLVSAGFDAHRDDPIGSLGLDFEDFARLTEAVRQVAEQYSGGRLVSVLEGGYNPGVVAGCVEVHLRGLLDREESPGDQESLTN
jgi:acetoin utilization deacetylase AcuC-like enzyme